MGSHIEKCRSYLEWTQHDKDLGVHCQQTLQCEEPREPDACKVLRGSSTLEFSSQKN